MRKTARHRRQLWRRPSQGRQRAKDVAASGSLSYSILSLRYHGASHGKRPSRLGLVPETGTIHWGHGLCAVSTQPLRGLVESRASSSSAWRTRTRKPRARQPFLAIVYIIVYHACSIE